MPFLIPRAPVRNGRVKSLRARAAVEEAERMGSPAVCWLKRSGWERGGAVVQPYFTPRLVMRGRRDSGRRKEGGICAQLVGSLGAMLFGLGWKLIWRFGSGWGRGENLYTETETSRERGQYQNSNTDNFNLDINYLVPSIIAQLYGKIHNITKWCIITPLTLFRHRLTSMLEKINSKVRNKFHLTETQKHMLTQPR